MKKVKPFSCKQPCNNCPYRKDSPLQHWHPDEFQKVLDSEKEFMGKVFSCHKQNGSTCIGWLMDQDRRGLPSLMLRLELGKHNIDRTYMDSLMCPSPLYDSVDEMIKENYPLLMLK